MIERLHMTCEGISRRSLLLGSGALFAWASLPKLARAEGRDPRMLTIVLRGALDGLATVAPVGDPDWISLRGDEALRLDSKAAALPLDSFFALNPAMPNFHRMYQAQEAIVVHAAASPYRERSHFDGQDVLESGLMKPGSTESGWLNRALKRLAADGKVNPQDSNKSSSKAFAVGPVTPLIARGPAPVLSWSPLQIAPASDDTMARLMNLYRHTDPEMARVLAGGASMSQIAKAGMNGKPGAPGGGINQVQAYFKDAVGTAARFLARQDGPRVGALALDGWDTHFNEGIAAGRLSQLLGALDGALGAAQSEFGDAWKDAAVVLVTEFGRTARINGTDGTDHGTATVALLAGGALKGGRVIADWPGLKEASLFEKRDLAPTTDLRAVLKGVLRDHLRADEKVLASDVFPGSENVKPLGGLTRAA
jgi:uncharacterized protein (DUF1501 family)